MTAARSLPHTGVAAPIAGRIDPPPGQLRATVDDWLAELAVVGKSPSTIRAYRTLLKSIVDQTGWSLDADVTYAAVTRWMAAKREAGEWMGTTYNNRLSALRSLTDFMRRTGRVAEDPLRDARRAEDDGGRGARAATTEEARAMVRLAWARQQADRRCRSHRALQRMCQFAAAMRVGEPALLRWKHLRLDDPVPHVAWTKDVQKNRRDQDVALAPELVVLLRRHREEMRGAPPVLAHDKVNKRRTERRADSNDPEAFVFASVSPKHTWGSDRDQLRIPAADHRGRTFSPHSSRKWFETTLMDAGVPNRVADALMRHSGDVGGRYLDQSLEAQAAVLAGLPRLWPEPLPELSTTAGVESPDLTCGPGRAQPVGADPGFPSPKTVPAFVPPPRHFPDQHRGPASDRQVGGGTIAGAFAGELGRVPGQVDGLSPPVSQDQNGHSGTENDGDLNDLASLLESVARLIRAKERSRVPQRADQR